MTTPTDNGYNKPTYCSEASKRAASVWKGQYNIINEWPAARLTATWSWSSSVVLLVFVFLYQRIAAFLFILFPACLPALARSTLAEFKCLCRSIVVVAQKWKHLLQCVANSRFILPLTRSTFTHIYLRTVRRQRRHSLSILSLCGWEVAWSGRKERS